jgi:hypothetical protein
MKCHPSLRKGRSPPHPIVRIESKNNDKRDKGCCGYFRDVTAQTVVLTVGSEDGFCEGEHMRGRLKLGNVASISLDDSPTQRSPSL